MASCLMFIAQFVDGDSDKDLESDSEEAGDENDTSHHTNDASLDTFESLSLGRGVSFHMLI